MCDLDSELEVCVLALVFVELLTFVEDLQNSDMYKQAFEKTVLLAEKRSVPENILLRNKADIDVYFRGGNGY